MTQTPSNTRAPAAIGTPGQPWGDAEKAAWLASQRVRRSYVDDVAREIDALGSTYDVETYGHLDYGGQGRFALLALRSRDWRADRPSALVTGGVHGYETSGVHGALRFLQQAAHVYRDRINLLVVPCVSPWAYQHIHRGDPQAIDPNRSFRAGSPSQEAAALMQLVAPLQGRLLMHIDLHETTDSDESEFRPALAARDGLEFMAGHIPDGFYLVADSARPQLAFQGAIVQAVAAVTPIAAADAQGTLIGETLLAPGVVAYDCGRLGLCAGMTDARYVTTTEVYPDGARATPAQCNAAQVAAVCAGLDHALSYQ